MATVRTAVRSAKKRLRSDVSNNLRTLSDTDVECESKAVLKRLLELDAFCNSRRISCYLSMNGEVDTFPIVHEILASGKHLFVPNIASRQNGRMDMLQIYGKEDIDNLPAGKWGIREPGPEWQGRRRASVLDEEEPILDTVLVPGVAFDRAMSRLGHGRGYYDFFINEYSALRQKPLLIALALNEQIIDRGLIPMDVHDRRMDYIVTPEGVIGEGYASLS